MKMGSTTTVIVINSSRVQQDQEALMAIFPEKFRIEILPNSGITLLVEEQLTLMLVASLSVDTNVTVAVLILESDIIRQVSKRAANYGVPMQARHCMAKLSLPGGTRLVATTAKLWKDSYARTTVTEFALAPSNAVGSGNEHDIFLSKSQKSPFPSLSRSKSIMKRSISMPEITQETAVAATIQSTAPLNSRLFPCLSVKVLKSSKDQHFSNFPLNARGAVPVETELFVGRLLLVMRPDNPLDDPHWNEKIFSTKKRRVFMQLQGKLKYKPRGELYAGMEISDPMNLGLLASGLCNM